MVQNKESIEFNQLLKQMFFILEGREKPLTIVAAGRYSEDVVNKFKAACKKTGKKANTDGCAAICHGKAGHKRCNWTKELENLVTKYFSLEEFQDVFTPEGKRFQIIAKELHRQRARRVRNNAAAGLVANNLVKKLIQVAKMADIHGAKIKSLSKKNDKNAFRLEIHGRKERKNQVFVFSVDANGVREKLPEHTAAQESPQN